jgi:hypothetical protein
VAGAIFGDWTHRRADAGGSRALKADLGRARLRVAWMWEAPHGSRIDQVRTSGDLVVIAAMGVSEQTPGWEHATVFVLDAASGKVVARRTLPDPLPVASLVLEGHVVSAVATARGEPVFTYSLSLPDLRPLHRGVVALDDPLDADVLDAWALPGGGLWLELEVGQGSLVYVAVAEGGLAASRLVLHVDHARTARDACESERALFVPAAPEAHETQEAEGLTPLLFKLDPAREGHAERRARPRRTVWARAETKGTFRTHSLAYEGLVYAVLAGSDARADLVAQVMAVDRTTAVERYKTPLSRLVSSSPGEFARLAFVNGEVALQTLSADGTPCSDVLLAGKRGALAPTTLGARRRFVLDAALGGALLAHATKADGRVVVAVFALDSKAGLLGRRARMQVSAETPDVGGASAVYAGSGFIFVKGEHRLVAMSV